MRTRLIVCLSLGLFLTLGLSPSGATNRYVWAGGAHSNGYTNWACAATNIQAAIDASANEDVICVTNGVYSSTGIKAQNSMLYINKAIRMTSVNGRDFTFINGNYPAVTNRCLYLDHSNAVVEGFTINNGRVDANGGGVYINHGTMQDCTISSNRTAFGMGDYGGGVCVDKADAVVTNCIISHNYGRDYGGGAYAIYGRVENCLIISNSAYYHGAGVAISHSSGAVVRACSILYNVSGINESGGSSGGGEGAGIWGWYVKDALIESCLIAGNQCLNYSAGVLNRHDTTADIPWTVRNCTIVGNRVTTGTQAAGGGVDYGNRNALQIPDKIINCIIYSNQVNGVENNWYRGPTGTNGVFSFTCTYPATTGANNITNNPMFMAGGAGYGLGLELGDCRLTEVSPCINAGTNAPGLGETDLAGAPRIYGGTVDMGAYEYPGPRKGTIVSFH